MIVDRGVVGHEVTHLGFPAQLVYTPHIAPKIEAWKEARQRQGNNRPRRAAAPHMAETRDDDDESAGRKSTDKKDSDAHSGMSVEMQDLVAEGHAAWTNTESQGTLRQRKGNQNTVLDEVLFPARVTMQDPDLSIPPSPIPSSPSILFPPRN